MLILVNKLNKDKYLNELAEMHRLRKRVFIDHCKWPIREVNGMEIDQFDTDDAHYLLYLNENGDVEGSTRLIPTTKPYLLGEVFPHLIEDGKIPKSDNIWETTRFCGDAEKAPKNIAGILAAGMLEFALVNGIKEYVSVSDIRIEKTIKRFGWVPQRLGKVIDTGTEMAAGERFEVSPWTYRIVSSKCKLSEGSIISNLNEVTTPNVMKEAA